MVENIKKSIEMFSHKTEGDTEEIDYEDLKEKILRLNIRMRHKNVTFAQMEQIVSDVKKLPTYVGKHGYYWDEDLDRIYERVK